jgi:branched-chain amino acid transport system ATP-binding protein
MDKEPALKIEDLRFGYEGARVIRGLNLELAEGDVVCLIGPNGAGKTTTLRVISGLERPDSGQIFSQGERIDGIGPKEILMRGISLIPQEGRLFRGMTVLENLLMGAYLRRDDKVEIDGDLKQIYRYFPLLEKRAGQRAGSLSGGERQMVALGRALMSRARVLLMDEPTSGLAPMLVAMIGRIILDINAEVGLSVVLVEQNAEMALNVARYGYVLERGRVAIEGETQEMLKSDQVRQTYLGL